MKQAAVKLALSAAAFLAVNLWLIAKAAAKGAEHWLISPAFEETVLFLLLQVFVIANFLVRPLSGGKSKVFYWFVSETLVLVTVLFWGIIVVGPIWFK